MFQKIKTVSSFFLILILLPYVITIFLNGVNFSKWKMDEEYLMQMMEKSLPASYEPEALKAQAVILRTQVYKDYVDSGKLPENSEETEYEDGSEKYREAIRATCGEVLKYEGSYVNAAYHQSNTGKTRSAEEVMGTMEFPYLKRVECPADKEAEDAMHTETFTYAQIRKSCQAFLEAVSEDQAGRELVFQDFEIKETDAAGYVKEIRIGESLYSGEKFRQALGLASSAFTLQDYQGKLRITTTGNGHGFGMSEWTANWEAKEGKQYKDILGIFFEGCEVIKDNEIFSKLE